MLVRPDGTAARFGMYISRTPYPGPATAPKNNDVKKWIDRFFDQYAKHRTRLEQEGKWPSKDLTAFRQSPTTTAPSDAELLTRQEMQAHAPDVLVTNYSMLEYMLLRPVDAPIFDQTEAWLAKDDRNQLIVVLDEAHMYQGAQGTEVALLLRRLVSRLRVTRGKVRFILTSASLAEGPGAEVKIRDFARKLTGGTGDGRSFEVVLPQLDKPVVDGPPSAHEAEAFARFDVSALRTDGNHLDTSVTAIQLLFGALGQRVKPILRGRWSIFAIAYILFCPTHRAYRVLGAAVMGRPTAYQRLATEVFGEYVDRSAALDGLLALAAFAQRASDEKILLPSRAHMLFRGLEGVFACTNVNCSERENRATPTILGRLYSQSRVHCACGARVYELLTHRDCGAAYLRGYFRPDNDEFLLHEPSTGLVDRTKTLIEVHLLVEHHRDQVGGSSDVWLHIATGKIERLRPSNVEGYLEMRQSSAQGRFIAGRHVNTFDGKCPVCRGRWNDPKRPKIMDLATKGEDPFAHLVATQVRLQPSSIQATRHSPKRRSKVPPVF